MLSRYITNDEEKNKKKKNEEKIKEKSAHLSCT